MRSKYLVLEILLAGAIAAGIAMSYPHLPARIPTHWGFDGRANGYGPRWMLYMLGPGIMTMLTALGLAIPWLSPQQFSVDSFRTTFERVMLIVVCLIGYINAAVLWGALGHRHNDAGQMVMGGICLFIALMGNLMGKVRRNFFIGVRTPWTLANERVWNATHRFAGKTFVAAGLVGVVLAIAGWRRGPIIALLLGALTPVVYSLVYYKRLERAGEL